MFPILGVVHDLTGLLGTRLQEYVLFSAALYSLMLLL
jgi:hypothetical protein